jgi:hypothetical protein
MHPGAAALRTTTTAAAAGVLEGTLFFIDP